MRIAGESSGRVLTIRTSSVLMQLLYSVRRAVGSKEASNAESRQCEQSGRLEAHSYGVFRRLRSGQKTAPARRALSQFGHRAGAGRDNAAFSQYTRARIRIIHGNKLRTPRGRSKWTAGTSRDRGSGDGFSAISGAAGSVRTLWRYAPVGLADSRLLLCSNRHAFPHSPMTR
jgi:hypothetical protein